MSTVEDNDLGELVKDLNIESDVEIAKGGVLDLKTLGDEQLENLKNFKVMRVDMVSKREALKKAINIMDKRIEITLAAIKVLQTPS